MNSSTAVTSAALEGYVLILSLISVVTCILVLVGMWKVFKKMGEPGWKCLIPFYNLYVLLKHVWSTKIFWAFLALSIITGLLMPVPTTAGAVATTSVAVSMNPILGIVFLVCSVALLVLSIMQLYYTAKAFGHGGLFTLLLMFFPFVGYLVLGFGSSEYIGPKGVPELTIPMNR